MILFYIDESGTGLKDKHSSYFVLSAFGIPAEEWSSADNQIAALKQRIVAWAKPEDFEIKGRDIRRGEKFFKGQNWDTRVQIIFEIAELITNLPCQITAIQVDKRDLPEYIETDEYLYRLSLWRLLDEIELALAQENQPGMLLFDMRSDLHSSVQDRRLVDAYRDWMRARGGRSHLIELPWFGFSAFYAGLQIADFCAYLIDFVSNEGAAAKGRSELSEAFERFSKRVKIVSIP
jgi:hypothetical protein